MTDVRLSVVVPLHNGARYIGETLNSLVGQSPAIHEVLVVDDGSSDDGRDIVEAHVLAPKVIIQDHHGVAVARNLGALAATGSHVAFLDHDDLWLAHRHERLVRWLAAHDPASVVVTTCTPFVMASDVGELRRREERLHEGATQIDDSEDPAHVLARRDTGELPPTLRLMSVRELLSGPPSVTASYVVPRELWLSTGGCFSLARSLDDYIGVLAVSRVAPVYLVDEPSLAYRVHPGSTTMTTRWNLALLTAMAAIRHGGMLLESDRARDEASVPPLQGERNFWSHQLSGLASSGSWNELLDALACAQLLGREWREVGRAAGRLIRNSARARMRMR
jgi:hypothetical protein